MGGDEIKVSWSFLGGGEVCRGEGGGSGVLNGNQEPKATIVMARSVVLSFGQRSKHIRSTCRVLLTNLPEEFTE